MSEVKRGKAAIFDDSTFEIKPQTETHDTPNTHDTPTTQTAPSAPKTQGQRVQKHPRINMAFYGDNLDYLKDVSWAARMSVTEYVNALVAEDRKKKGK